MFVGVSNGACFTFSFLGYRSQVAKKKKEKKITKEYAVMETGENSREAGRLAGGCPPHGDTL